LDRASGLSDISLGAPTTLPPTYALPRAVRWRDFDKPLALVRYPEPFVTLASYLGGPSLQGELVMRRVAEYELRAEECRELAAHIQKDPEQKKQLEEMAQAWELLARARLKHLQNGWEKPTPSK
jgi:hypothetical protein